MRQALYRSLAKYYDKLYYWKDYSSDVNSIKTLVSRHKRSSGKDLLDIACGTGKHLRHLKRAYACEGLDNNKEILEIAKKAHKDIKFHNKDMISFNLKKRFDIITCLFSSIGYVKTKSNLKKTIMNFSRHLKKGGIVLIEPWFDKKNFHKGMPHMNTYEDENIKIARLNVSDVKRNISFLRFHYLIAEKNKKIRHYEDTHELGLFSVDETLEIMKKAGLQSRYLKNGLEQERGLYIGIKI